MTSFKHHFEDSDFNTVRTMFANAAQNGDSTNPKFLFVVTCKDDQVCEEGSLAVTDTWPRNDEEIPRMRLCAKIFDPNTPQTKNDSQLQVRQEEPEPS